MKEHNVITLSANTSWYLYNFRASTIRRFIEDGYQVFCLSPEDDYSIKLRADLKCEWLPLKMDNQASNPIKDIALIFQLWRYYRELKPKAAFHFTIKNNIYGTWAARSLKIPAFNNVSGLGTAFIRAGLVSRIVRLLYKSSMPLAEQVFCQNEEDANLLIDNKLVPANRLKLLPGSGVNLQRFNPGLRKTHNGAFRFLFAGRMLADKGLYELIEAVRQLNAQGSACDLWLCGFSGVENASAIPVEELESWANESFIRWLGPSDLMESVFAAVDCVVLPSYREGMPRSLLEAGAMGIPVVATNVPGCRNIIHEGFNGLLCEVKNSRSLQLTMKRILDMPREDLKLLGENARRLVSEKFDEKLVVDATVQAVKSLS